MAAAPDPPWFVPHSPIFPVPSPHSNSICHLSIFRLHPSPLKYSDTSIQDANWYHLDDISFWVYKSFHCEHFLTNSFTLWKLSKLSQKQRWKDHCAILNAPWKKALPAVCSRSHRLSDYNIYSPHPPRFLRPTPDFDFNNFDLNIHSTSIKCFAVSRSRRPPKWPRHSISPSRYSPVTSPGLKATRASWRIPKPSCLLSFSGF